MVSDSELANRLREVLWSSDLGTATAASIRRRLEADFGVDLTERKNFIREEIGRFLQSQDAEPRYDDVGPEVEVANEHSWSGEENPEGREEEEEEVEVEKSNKEGTKKEMLEKTDKHPKKRGNGFSKPCALSPQLQEFVGVSELARNEVVKKIWAYIREKNLKNPKNRRKVLCDEALRRIFRVNTIDMFQMNKALSRHIWPIDKNDALPVKSSEKEKRRKQDWKEVPNEQHFKGKRPRVEGSGFLAPLKMSDALINFFGTSKSALSRADVTKQMWQYIKENQLQDPSDKRQIICDDKLKDLFEVDSFHGFTVSKLLAAHLMKTER